MHLAGTLVKKLLSFLVSFNDVAFPDAAFPDLDMASLPNIGSLRHADSFFTIAVK
jgi:hypothetical protein